MNSKKNIWKSKLLNLYEINDNKKKEYEDIFNKINSIYKFFIDNINSLKITEIKSWSNLHMIKLIILLNSKFQME